MLHVVVIPKHCMTRKNVCCGSQPWVAWPPTICVFVSSLLQEVALLLWPLLIFTLSKETHTHTNSQPCNHSFSHSSFRLVCLCACIVSFYRTVGMVNNYVKMQQTQMHYGPNKQSINPHPNVHSLAILKHSTCVGARSCMYVATHVRMLV